jgi:hypothetical protein
MEYRKSRPDEFKPTQSNDNHFLLNPSLLYSIHGYGAMAGKRRRTAILARLTFQELLQAVTARRGLNPTAG